MRRLSGKKWSANLPGLLGLLSVLAGSSACESGPAVGHKPAPVAGPATVASGSRSGSSGLGVLAGKLAASSPVSSPDSLGLQATVFAVVDSIKGDHDYSVRLPQVRLCGAGQNAARRINAALVRELTRYLDDPAPTLPAGKAVRLTRPWLADSASSDNAGNFSYRVLYNAHGLLSLALELNQQGRSITEGHHVTFSLLTGRPVALASLFEYPGALSRSFFRRQQADLKELREDIAEELADDPPMRAQLLGELGLHAATKLADADFALTRRGLVIYEDHQQDFPKPYYNLAFQQEYEYSLAELRPWRGTNGPWLAGVRQGAESKK